MLECSRTADVCFNYTFFAKYFFLVCTFYTYNLNGRVEVFRQMRRYDVEIFLQFQHLKGKVIVYCFLVKGNIIS